MSRASTIVACTLAILVAGVAFFLLKSSKQASEISDAHAWAAAWAATTSSAVVAIEQTPYLAERTVPAGMREYRSVQYHFSLFYPQELTVDEHQEDGGAMTITFQNVEKGEGFQIFVMPYSESQVSEERFKQDEPSGVRESLTNITVDGAIGAAFYSTNTALGATREVWFIHDGFLYELTTLKPLDSWLDSIIQSWKFI